jgi:hypothetical protein
MRWVCAGPGTAQSNRQAVAVSRFAEEPQASIRCLGEGFDPLLQDVKPTGGMGCRKPEAECLRPGGDQSTRTSAWGPSTRC